MHEIKFYIACDYKHSDLNAFWLIHFFLSCTHRFRSTRVYMCLCVHLLLFSSLITYQEHLLSVSLMYNINETENKSCNTCGIRMYTCFVCCVFPDFMKSRKRSLNGSAKSMIEPPEKIARNAGQIRS